MTLGVMQPYFFPYLGYWQLLAAVDRFVVYDNLQYTKKGWINRNRFLRSGVPATFTLPLKKGSDFLSIADRTIAEDFDPGAMLKSFAAAYRKAPYFSDVFPWFENVVASPRKNLFDYLHHSLQMTAAYLDIQTPIVVSSTVGIDHGLKAERKVIALCEALGATQYVNLSGGRDLYSSAAFTQAGVELRFIQSRPISYPQFDHMFVPALSIVDVLMFNDKDAIGRMLREYDLETPGPTLKAASR